MPRASAVLQATLEPELSSQKNRTLPLTRLSGIRIAETLVAEWDKLNKGAASQCDFQDEIIIVLAILLARLSNLPPETREQVEKLHFIWGANWKIGGESLQELYQHGCVLAGHLEEKGKHLWTKVAEALKRCIQQEANTKELQPICLVSRALGEVQA
ncbi:hypothetical protein NliqN6_5810 [Naganishia liquefaciens]|uniref:Uncharacterized protein n=1 Tax=Naganishia liquefaciens TaxID=104408 RepID=A0A8H3YHJ2_9TREE|nr:hypothetical protein NliqN6_5810 [Naganishia liquefaciens]